MEIRPEGSEFKVYNKGGLNLKILVIHLPEETVDKPVQMRAEQGWTVAELKTAIAQVWTSVICHCLTDNFLCSNLVWMHL